MTRAALTDDDELLVDDESSPAPSSASPTSTGPRGAVPPAQGAPYRVLVADDDEAVRTISQLALQGMQVDGSSVELVCVASAAEARVALRDGRDYAVAILDVVMETEQAGLDLARWIRASLPDAATRIVLRTGQPGSAPEAQVVQGLDVHDYLSKTETTARRLVTCVTGAVRAWNDLRTIRDQRAILRRAMGAVASLFAAHSPETLPRAVVGNIAALLAPRTISAVFACPPDIAESAACAHVVVAGTHDYAGMHGVPLRQAILRDDVHAVIDAVEPGKAETDGERIVYAFDLDVPVRPVLVIEAPGLTAFDREVVQLFCHSASLAMRNCRLWDTQRVWVRAMERFVPGALSDLVGAGDLRAIRPGDNATHDMTVCFVDVRGFTARTARVGGNAAFRSLNLLFTSLGDVVAQHGGVIDKYLGDGMLVLFPQAPENALRAALEMQRRARALPMTAGEEPLRIGIGMHTGDVVVGAVGHPDRLDISVVSPVVNLAARLQEMARWLDCDIVVTQEVIDALPAALRADTRPLLRHAIRGDLTDRTLHEAFAALEPSRVAACRTSAALLEELTADAAAGRWSALPDRLLSIAHADDPVVDSLVTLARARAEGKR